LFKTSFSSWRDAWLLDIGATCDMNFQRDFFEELNESVYGAEKFVDGSNLKPMGINTTMLNLLGFPNFIFHNVLYFVDLWGKLLSLVHIRKQDQCIHIIH
jgi:hypothetical protein